MRKWRPRGLCYAKFTGELGVCIATSGPGASQCSLVCTTPGWIVDRPRFLVGQQARTALGAHYQQELDLQNMFKDVAGAYVEQAAAPTQVRHMIDRGIRTALAERRLRR